MIVVGEIAIAINSIAQVIQENDCLRIYRLDGHNTTLNKTESAEFLNQVNAMAAEAEKQLVRQRAAQSGIIGVN